MTTKNTANRILVLGSTGKTGSRVFQTLNAQGITTMPGSRSAATPFDWDNQATWGPVLEHVDAIYVSYQPDLCVPEALGAITAFTKLAVKNGVKKLVLLSGRGEPEAQAAEAVIMNAGVDWTIIRASWFCQNFSEGYLAEPIQAGHVALPVPPIGEPFIDVDDISEIAVAALTTDDHNGKLYEVTGPRLLSFEEAIAEIARATGKSIQYQHISMDEYAGMMKEYGIPNEFISLITYLFTVVLDGRNAHVTDGVEQALSRKATDFSTYIKKAMAAGVWG
ncbi:NmrA family transcriptional regulator [Paraflavitalea soli]|uniref:NmrA family transcriptional regulator n=1 Tax=Paraflavitalea soli TaxID=2315862 RepID=A0A3B7MVT5_9BACT|nr:NmrA family transcriptional regulator [Paraflavitalea soli]AXY78208.1 NmrA family transcriptional regulator [Paraflavitalea soli]